MNATTLGYRSSQFESGSSPAVMGSRILVVDDDPGILFGLKSYLSEQGYEVCEAHSCEAAKKAYHMFVPDAAIIDYVLPDGNALSLLPGLLNINADVPIVILTGYGSIDLAVRAMREGAEDFLTKPLELARLGPFLEQLLNKRLQHQRKSAGKTKGWCGVLDPFIGTNILLRRLEKDARKVLATNRPVLILGETGTGKGTLATWLHRNSSRSKQPFVSLNCVGLRSDFLETELFGHAKGAFTGATATKPGLFEVADGGTIFLDEVADMDLQVQAKLLTVIEEHRFRQLGDVRDRQVDVRLILATQKNLQHLVQEDSFRNDLYFRIAIIPLAIPPLRERVEDILPLSEYILKRFFAELDRHGMGLAPGAIEALKKYSWPGNIRELRNVLERAVLLNETEIITADMLHFDPTAPSSQGNPAHDDHMLESVERRHIEKVLRIADGHVGQAAAILGVPRSTLYCKLKRYGLRPRA